MVLIVSWAGSLVVREGFAVSRGKSFASFLDPKEPRKMPVVSQEAVTLSA